MRIKALAFLAALWLAVLPARATLTTTQLHGFNAGGSSGPATVTYVGLTAAGAGAATEWTFTNHATGTAAATRVTIVGVCSEDGATDFSVSSMTIGGVAANEQVDTVTVSTGSLVVCAIYTLANPTGTTATIVVTMSESVGIVKVAVWAGYNMDSATALSVGNAFSTNSSSMAADLATSATDGFAVGVCASGSPSESPTWTGLTEDEDESAVSIDFNAASDATTTASHDVDCDQSGSDDSVVVTAAFG